MFFRLHIFVLTILQVSKINSFTVPKDIKPGGKSANGNEKTLNFEGARRINGSTYPKHNPFFEMIQNLTKAKNPNLKLNVFDKMLSDEMFSIKQHLYEKDMVSPSSVYIAHESNAPTPTIEVKQRWPVVESMLSKWNGDRYNKTPVFKNNAEDAELVYEYQMSSVNTPPVTLSLTNENVDNSMKQNNKSNAKDVHEKNFIDNTIVLKIRDNEPKEKVIDLRSLHNEEQADIKVCTCMKPNLMATCTHHCTGSNTRTCTHRECTHTTRGPRCPTYHPLLTTTILPFSAYNAVYMPAQPYQPYFIREYTDSPYANTYYQPNVLNNLKVPKKPKHRKSPKRYKDDHLYYDSNDSKEKYYYDDSENDAKHIQTPQTVKVKPVKPKDVIIKIDYDDTTQENYNLKNTKIRFTEGAVGCSQNKFVDDIIHDLKTRYSDTVIKDCYCSFASKLKIPTIMLSIGVFIAHLV